MKMNENVNMNPEEDINALEKYGIDLTKLASEGRIDPVIGREEEIRRIIQILSRRTKNNPVLIGDPGTGKTTVVEGLARRIIEGDVPENIKGKQLVALDLSAMVAGAMYRGQFEERLKNFIKQVVESDGEIIVFIDELHMIVGAGKVDGQMDVSNMIKPELARGRMKVVGATTLNEYQKHIEQDAALERRFQQVYIAEPSVEDTITILRGIKDKYELHHGLHIKDSSLISAATLSDRYITGRFLPDKAVDLMDEAAAKIRMEMNSAPAEIDDARRMLIQLEIEREVLKKEKDKRSKERLELVKEEISNLKSKLDGLNKVWEQEKSKVSSIQELKTSIENLSNQADQAQREGDYQRSAKIQYDDIPKLDAELEKLNEDLSNSKFLKLEVETEDIAEVVSKWTGIPVQKMLAGEQEKLLHLEDLLSQRVIGQEEAVTKVADVIRMSKIGIVDQSRPLGSFLFMGNTGVGKTELAKTLAQVLFDDEKALTRIDMSEYMEQHSVAKLIGSPPGYVGYDEGGQLTERIRRRPYAVVLFDEIEKAHPNVLNILLQILDDGRLTDTKGRTVNFKNTIIIMTSNIPVFELKQELRPEFINRIDEILNFNDLGKEVVHKIVDLQVQQAVDTFFKQGIKIKVDDSLRNYLCTHGYQPEYGARPVRRLIKEHILAPVAKYLLSHPEVKELEVSNRGEELEIQPIGA
ncbi:MAG: AAA family ATPase [Candidatus Marinimicrobia bacterium]|nr:AAA family ATPase [Candidatus Neomarinimicrobiota bacterium]MCF7905228.1 AAA family ATPase [Candidatus Neomarinimicrobiota bacterium]